MGRAAESPLPPIEEFESFPTVVEFALLNQAVHAGDWGALQREIDLLPSDDVFYALQLLAEADGTEVWFESTVRQQPESPLAATLLAMRYIAIGWPHPTRHEVPQETPERWKARQQWLAAGDRLLQGVHSRHPTFAPAWAASITTARGLRLDPAVKAQRYAGSATVAASDLAAEAEYLQVLLPKWGGSLDAASTFAYGVGTTAAPGSCSAAIIPYFEIEKWLTNGHGFHATLELAHPSNLERLRDAARRSVLHPDHRFGPVSVLAHSTFALAFLFADCPIDAAPHLRALGTRATEIPWRFHPFGQGPAFVTTTRDRALAAAARKGI